MSRRWRELCLILGLVLAASGCSSLADADQPAVSPDQQIVLRSDRPVGQTLVARHAGLQAIEVYLQPAASPPGEGELVLRLTPGPEAAAALASGRMDLASVDAPGYYRIAFPTQPDSHGAYYYAILELLGEQELLLGAGPPQAYLDGALYLVHQPQEAQMAFRLVYDRGWIVRELVSAAAEWLAYLLAAGLLFVLPGWALLGFIQGREEGLLPHGWAARLGLAIGLSLAVYPLLLLWADVLGVRLGALAAWLPPALALGALVWRCRPWRQAGGRLRTAWRALRAYAATPAAASDLALVMVAALVVGVRLLVVRTLDAPMWGDSYQHTMMTQLIIDHGGLFESWAPYADLHSFTYHFGFHSLAAAFHWVSGLETRHAVLWGGQVLNALAVLALYPLALRVSGSRLAGVAAVLLAGLLSPMPMAYTNWGRYTQLAGQAILPAAVLLTWAAIEGSGRRRPLIGLCWLAVGGLALIHYRVLIFYLCFVAAVLLFSLPARERWERLLKTALVGLGGAVLFLPWFLRTFGGGILLNFIHQMTTRPTQVSDFTQTYNAIGPLSAYLHPVWWLLAPLALVAGLWRRERPLALFAMWWFLLFLATNPALIGLPGTGAISNFALFIAAYIPIGVLVGSLAARLAMRLEGRRWAALALAAALVGVGAAGLPGRIRDIQPAAHALVTRPDLRAMAWVQANTPPEAVFLVNSFFAYGDSVIVGSDGGWWLPLLAGRANTAPPLNYATEVGPRPDYRPWINELTAVFQAGGAEDAAFLAMLKERGVTHVYIGQQQGRVNYGGPHVLQPEALAASPHYHPLYHQDRVWVFEVLP